MSSLEIDRYLKAVPARQREILSRLRLSILKEIPKPNSASRIACRRFAWRVVWSLGSLRSRTT